jgi:quinol monooxygenase YgiN/uncharacterized protein YndB with AHSA1/START domain
MSNPASFVAPRAVTDGDTVLATADVTLSPQQAFDAFVTAEVEEWWGEPGLYRMTDWRSKLEVGGEWSVNVVFADGVSLPASGRFTFIDRPHRVAHTRTYHWDHPTIGQRETTVTYSFAPIEGGTRVTIRHEGFAGIIPAAVEHAGGWERVLGYLCTEPDRAAARRDAVKSFRANDRLDGKKTTETQTFSPEDGTTAILSMIRARLKDDTKPFTLIIRTRMHEGLQHTVDAAFAAAREQTLAEPGALSFELNHDSANPDEIVVYESWRSLGDIEVHMRKPYFTALRSAFEAMAAGSPELQVLTPV